MQKQQKNVIITAVLALVLLTSCAPPNDPDPSVGPDKTTQGPARDSARVESQLKEPRRETIISVVPKSLDNPVFLDTKQSVEQTAAALNISVEWVGPFSSESQSQVEVLRWLVRRRVDAILVSANDPDALTQAINEAVQSGIAVATFDSDAPDSRRLFYTGTDNSAAGRTGAEVVLDLLEERGRQVRTAGEGEPARIVVVTGQKEALNLQQRIEGFESRLQGTNSEIVELLYCNDDMNLAVQLTEQAATTDPDVIFFIGGWVFYAPPESLAVYQEWLAAGGIAVTIDKHYPVLTALKEGRIQAAVGQNFKEMGEVGLRRLYEKIQGGEVDDVYFTPIEVVTPENVDRYLAEAPNFEIR